MSEIEKTLIGIVLREPSNFFEAKDLGLEPVMFQVDRHQAIWRAFEELATVGETISLLTAATKLPNDTNLLVDALEGATVAVNLPWMVGQVRAKKWLVDGALALSSLANEMMRPEAVQHVEALKTRISNLSITLLDAKHAAKDIVSFEQTSFRFSEEIEARVVNHEQGQARGLPISLKVLQEGLHGWLPGRFYIVAARPAVGKTTIALNFAETVAEKGKKVFFASNEMGDLELFEKMLAKNSGVFADLIMGGDLKEHERDRVMSAMRKLSGYPIWVGLTAGRSIESFEAACYRMKRENGLDIAFLDYVQQVRVSGKKFANSNRVVELTYISDRLKQLSRDLQIPIIALAQINREVESSGKTRMPTLANLKDSGSLEQDADAVLILHREMQKTQNPKFSFEGSNNEPNFIDEMKYFLAIAKNRLGMTANFEIKADLALNRFSDL